MFGLEALDEALQALGAVLESRGVSCGIAVAGGSSMLLLGLIDRPTADVDVVGLSEGESYVSAEPLPPALVQAQAQQAAAAQPTSDPAPADAPPAR